MAGGRPGHGRDRRSPPPLVAAGWACDGSTFERIWPVQEAILRALSTERRAQNFYVDVAEHASDDTVCAFAAEMAADEQRHVTRLELLLAREPETLKVTDEDAEILRR